MPPATKILRQRRSRSTASDRLQRPFIEGPRHQQQQQQQHHQQQQQHQQHHQQQQQQQQQHHHHQQQQQHLDSRDPRLFVQQQVQTGSEYCTSLFIVNIK